MENEMTKIDNYNKNNKKAENDMGEDEIDDFCDLDPNKICDNCCKCIKNDKNYKIIKITKIITDAEDMDI